MDAEILQIESERIRIKTPLGEWNVLPSTSLELNTGTTCTLAFRPEAVVCDATESAVNVFTGRIEKSAFLGESSFRTISAANLTISVNEYAGPERADGIELRFAIAPDKICILEK